MQNGFRFYNNQPLFLFKTLNFRGKFFPNRRKSITLVDFLKRKHQIVKNRKLNG